MSDDGRHGLTLIAFVGSVFSPYYALARRRGAADPEHHCALNLALYGPCRRWAMTERPARAVRRSRTDFAIGPSSLTWDGDGLTIRIDEIAVPWPSRIRGVVRVRPAALLSRSFALDGAGHHRWWPIAPHATVEVALERPALGWSGRGYLDSNWGAQPLEDGFRHWHWSRADLGDATAVLYDVTERDGRERSIGIRVAPGGEVEDVAAPVTVTLPPTRWRIGRATRTDQGAGAEVARTLEDTPFYARSLVRSRLLGKAVTAVHESLSLERFRRPWVQLMLPFRMPRALR